MRYGNLDKEAIKNYWVRVYIVYGSYKKWNIASSDESLVNEFYDNRSLVGCITYARHMEWIDDDDDFTEKFVDMISK